MSSWLMAPPVAWNRNLKITPVTIRGSSQGTMMSERASVLPGNRKLKSKAREKPMMNWKTSDQTVNSSVRAIADRLVGSSKMER